MIYFNKRMIFSISLFLICICGANAAGYNYSKFNWDDYIERYGSYWTNTCDDDETGKCVERVLNTQKKFYNDILVLWPPENSLNFLFLSSLEKPNLLIAVSYSFLYV